jgi:hypothetical protein
MRSHGKTSRATLRRRSQVQQQPLAAGHGAPTNQRPVVDRGLAESHRVAHDLSRIPIRPGASEAASSGRQGRATVARYPLRASLRRGPEATASYQPAAAPSRADASRGSPSGEELGARIAEVAAPTAEPAGDPLQAASPEVPTPETQAPETPAPEVGAETPVPGAAAAPIALPDIVVPELAQIGKSDAVNPAFTYSGSIARGGDPPAGFGVTRSFGSMLTGVTVTPNAKTFDIVATLEHPITYQVRSATGPRGQKDISGEQDADISDDNYPTVASDLTPDPDDLNGRPPRTKFWAEDLTLQHELVHANDDRANGPAAMSSVATWLGRQIAFSMPGVNALLGRVPGRFAMELLAALSSEDGERHAYGDGTANYQARSEAIMQRGDAGFYRIGDFPTPDPDAPRYA